MFVCVAVTAAKTMKADNVGTMTSQISLMTVVKYQIVVMLVVLCTQVDFSTSATWQADVSTLQDLQAAFNISETSSDPCEPEPWSWVNCTSSPPQRIRSLNLSNRPILTGVEIPSSIANLASLTKLGLRGCNLSGEIPPWLGTLTNLEELDLGINKLAGNIPDLSSLKKLKKLYMDLNKLSGTTSNLSLTNFPNLSEIWLLGNSFTGPMLDISDHPQLQSVRFDSNKFSGPIPSMKNIPALINLDLGNNRLEGNIPDLSSLSELKYLKLGDNLLRGEPANFVSNLTKLEILWLNNNSFSGRLPDISPLLGLQNWDLSHNNLESAVPDSFVYNLRNINLVINLVKNNFSSMPRILAERGPSQIEYDPYLFSNTSLTELGAKYKLLKPNDSCKRKPRDIVGLLLAICGYILLLIIVLVIVFIKRYGKLLFSQDLEMASYILNELEKIHFGPQMFTYNELKVATNKFNESEVLGYGGFGIVYRGKLRKSGKIVAVKHISKTSQQGVREFLSEIKIIGRMNHPNLVQLLGWCYEKSVLLLVYEYMSNGSLDQYLFGKDDRSLLPWSQRYEILCGVAKALEFLHEDWEKKVVHRDVKASNVLLDKVLKPHLGDFGMARLYDHSGLAANTTAGGGTWGYMAPECESPIARNITDKADVYSFGILMLETVCGRKPLDPQAPINQIFLLGWVWDLYTEGNLIGAVDPRMLKGDENLKQDEVIDMLHIGLICSHPDPEKRPSMQQVLGLLRGNIPISKPLIRPDVVVSRDVLQNGSTTPDAFPQGLGRRSSSLRLNSFHLDSEIQPLSGSAY